MVIDEKANLYRSAKSVDVTGTILPRGIVGVRFPGAELRRDALLDDAIRRYPGSAFYAEILARLNPPPPPVSPPEEDSVTGVPEEE